MKRIILFCCLYLCSIYSMAQTAKKPTIMIVPSDNWCTQRYFTLTFEDQGRQIRIPDYQTAFQEDTELGGVISKLGELLTAKGYSLKDCEQEIKVIAQRTTEDNVTMSKQSGAMIAENPIDQLKRRVKSDVIIQIGWQVNKEALGKSITFTLEAFDAYSSKRIATASGTGEPSTEPIPVILESSVRNSIEGFDQQMSEWYNKIRTDGREIVMTIRCWDNWDNDLESEFNGEELLDCIQNWMHKNTINGVFNLTDNTESMAQFEQIHIPLFDENGKAVDARSWATKLRKYLQQEYGITSKVMVRGLGEANLILGEK